jgi:hypothetical protein
MSQQALLISRTTSLWANNERFGFLMSLLEWGLSYLK